MSHYYEQDEYVGAYVDPALLSPPQDGDYLSPVGEDGGYGTQSLWSTPSSALDGPPASQWLDGGDSKHLGASLASPSTKKGRKRSSHASGHRKTSERDVAEASAPAGPENDATRKLSTRERNRIAACRSRLKKSRDIKNLEEEERLVSIKRECLSAYVAGLQSEVFELENMLLAHRDCDCVVIQKYFKVRKGIDWLEGDMDSVSGGSHTPTQG